MSSATAIRPRVHRIGSGRLRFQGGFSLLEVVVAFSILALTLGVLMQIFSQAITTTVLGGNYSRAATLAEARLNSVGGEIPLEPGSYNGEPEDGLAWELHVESYELGDVSWEPTLEPFLVTAVASWEEGSGRRRQISLTTLRLAADSELGGLAQPGGALEPAPAGGAKAP